MCLGLWCLCALSKCYLYRWNRAMCRMIALILGPYIHLSTCNVWKSHPTIVGGWVRNGWGLTRPKKGEDGFSYLIYHLMDRTLYHLETPPFGDLEAAIIVIYYGLIRSLGSYSISWPVTFIFNLCTPSFPILITILIDWLASPRSWKGNLNTHQFERMKRKR